MLRPLTLLLSLTLLGCRALPPDAHSPSGGCHPACPGARAGEVPDAGTALRGDVAPPAAADVLAHPPSAAAYLCPMHPWIGSDAHGRCTECGMELLERAKVLESGRAK